MSISARPSAQGPAPASRWAGVWGWLTTTDHKKIGLMYLWTSLILFFVAGFEALALRLQLFGPRMSVLTPDTYNHTLTLHGTSMIFLVVIPALTGFGNYFVPLLIGAKDMAFPRLNAISYWLYPLAGLLLYSSLFVGPPAQAGWTGYPPLTDSTYSPGFGTDLWILSLHLLGISSILGGLNFIVTILNLRAPGMRLNVMPLFVWTWLVTAWLQVIATPLLAGVLTMLLFDRNFGTSFFKATGGGDPVLWQHLFWSYSHPAVYIMILSGFGIVSEVLPVFSRKPIFGYLAIAYSSVAIGVLGFVVWAHHMFQTGIDVRLRIAIMVTTMLIAIPTGVKIFSWLATLWGGDLQFHTPMLFATSFVAFFVIGGLSGIFLASIPVDIAVTQTYFVVAHIHYVLFAGSMIALFAAFYYWFPKMSGRMLSEPLGKWHFWLTITAMNVAFFPMHFLGVMGMPRRIATYAPVFTDWNRVVSVGAFVLGAAQLLLIINVVQSLRRGPPAPEDPWGGHTLEWTVSSPPPAENFPEVPRIAA
ncbi:MAG: cytochrome c oxidase subunit I [Candidatus Sericytochromatia bacterium]|nr:cytochrome c oxidase subunit I [Candidatus Sericytochromatia bacterium]